MREFNPAIVAYLNIDRLLKTMPKEKPKTSGILSPRFTENKSTSDTSKEPLFRVAKHMEVLRQREDKNA